MFTKTIIAGVALGLATVVASAADLPSRVAPPVFVPPPPIGYSWTGAEFGLTTSYSFSANQPVSLSGNDAFTSADLAAGSRPSVVSLKKNGFDTVGGGLGYNYQFTPGSGLVIGGIVDVSFFNLTKNVGLTSGPEFVGGVGNQNYFHERLGYLGTANGRIGYGIDHFLIYGLGGFAFGQVHEAATLYTAGIGPAYFGTRNNTRTGYDYGGGAEYAIPNDSFLNYFSVEKLLGFDKTLGLNLFESTIRVEYVHYNLGSQDVLLGNTGALPGSYTARFKTEGNVIRAGLGYKYGGAPAPVVARY